MKKVKIVLNINFQKKIFTLIIVIVKVKKSSFFF